MTETTKLPERLFKALDGQPEALPDSRVVRFCVSTGDVDRDSDVISQDGWDLSNYRRSPVVLWAHSHSALPIAKCIAIDVEQGRLMASAEFATHPFAETVYQLLKGGFLRATSVGFRALKYMRNEERGGIDFKQQELLEFSVVPVPANAHALIAASAGGVELEPLREWVQDVIEAWPGEMRMKGKAWDKLTPATAPGLSSVVTAKIEFDADKAADQIEALAAQAEARLTRIFGAAYQDALSAVAPTERWNKSLPAAFNVADEEFPARSHEQALVSRYCGCKVKDLHHVEERVRGARMGTFLAALEDVLDQHAMVEDVRNLGGDGREAPPLYETIQLNSTRTQEFLVDGLRFMTWNGEKTSIRVEPKWYGLLCTVYGQRASGAAKGIVDAIKARARELKLLKGEAFSLSGEFLTRGTESLDDLFLDEKNQSAIRRYLSLLNEDGAAMECRGGLLVGPPGTGKTLSGRILMNHAKATFLWLSSKDFWAGGGFSSIAMALEIAREHAPSIVFMEDVDNWLDGYTVDLLKTELDGIQQHKGVLTILTTNYPEHLPKALIDRPGRFHDVLRFDLPKDAAREAMLRKWLPELTDALVATAVTATAGYSGAHVRELTRFAGMIARQDQLPLAEALVKAIEKLQEQRDLITSVQSQGSRYRAYGGAKTTAGLSERHEQHLAWAKSHAESAAGLVGEVLASVERPAEQDADLFELADDDDVLDLEPWVLGAAAEPAVVELEFEPEAEDVVQIGDEAAFRESLADVMRGVVAEVVGDMVRSAASDGIRQARGRLD